MVHSTDQNIIAALVDMRVWNNSQGLRIQAGNLGIGGRLTQKGTKIHDFKEAEAAHVGPRDVAHRPERDHLRQLVRLQVVRLSIAAVFLPDNTRFQGERVASGQAGEFV